MDLPKGTGSFQMELEFPAAVVTNGISTEPEISVWYFCIVEEVEWRGSTDVSYRMLSRAYTLECTAQALVRYRVIVEFEFEFRVQV